MYRRNIAAVVI